MTLNANDVRDEYTASASQTVFNYTFKIYESTDLDVYVTPAGQECSDADLTTAYTVTGVGAESGGTITLTTPASAGDMVTIVSSIPSSRTTDYQNNGSFRPDTVNDDFDRAYSLVKQALDKTNRSLQFPACQQGVSSLSLPSPVANSFVRWKGDLSGLENYQFQAGGAVADAYEVSYNTVTVGTYLDNKEVADYTALLALSSIVGTQIADGDACAITDSGIAGVGYFRNVVGHGFTSTNGVIVRLSDDWYWEREYKGAVSVSWFDSASDAAAALQSAVTNYKKVEVAGALATNASTDLVGGGSVVGQGVLETTITGSFNKSDTTRGTVLSDFTLQAPTPGVGNGIDGSTGVNGFINSKFENLYINNFDIGYEAGDVDFSNELSNVRANSCRVSFNLAGAGQIIQNVLSAPYSSAPTEMGMYIDGVKGLVIDGFNSGSTGAPHVRVGLNSTGVVFNSPNFEQDSGSLSAGASAVLIGSASEVTLNSPTFASPSAASGGYLIRVNGSAVVRIKDPKVIAEGSGIDFHLSVENTAIVYLDDPLGEFDDAKISVSPTAQLIRVYDKFFAAPDYAEVMTLSDGDIIATPRRALHAEASVNVRLSGGSISTTYAGYNVVFDNYSGASVRVRFFDTQTGAFDTLAASVPCFVKFWYTELPLT